jgi:tetratricopeptide (TPR) repeat protein
MDPLTLGGTVIGILAAVAGIVAAVVQVREYLEKRRKKPDGSAQEVRPLTPPPAPQVPHNLPPRREFVGREAEKARVHEALRSRYPLTSIDGIGGIGKTVLALEVAHECLRASKSGDSADDMATFDGFIWTTAKDRDLTLNALLDAVARTLDYPGIAQQPIEEKRIAVRKLLQENPHLLIVDNFETIADEGVRDFLLDLPEPSKALITTREQKLRQAWAISLKGLAETEALALIRSAGRRLGLTSLERAQDQVLLYLYRATGGAPLAIKWAVGHIKQRGQSLDTVLTALHEARGSIFDNIFVRSWDLLLMSARQVLIVMPIFAASASRAGIEAASDVHHFALDEALGQLVEMSLVDATDELDLAQRRYSVHPLTRAFAASKLQQEPQTRQIAQQRLADYFKSLHWKRGICWDLENFPQLESDLPNILAVIQWCWSQGPTELGLDIFYLVAHLMATFGYWNETKALSEQAVELATDLGHELRAARFRVWPISWIYRHRGNLDSAQDQVALALNVFKRFGDERGIARAKRNLGRIAQERGDFEQARELLGEALTYFRTVGNERSIYLATTNLADVALKQGDLDIAWTLCDSILASARRFGDPERMAKLLSVLGGVAHQRGDLEQARSFWEESLAYMKQANRLDGIADCLFELAHLDIEKGREQTARQMLSNSLESYRRLGVESRVREIEELLVELPPLTNGMTQEGEYQQVNEE